MANPKRKHSRSRRDKRRANWKLEAPNSSACPQCQSAIMSHRACPNCGYYKGEIAIIVKEKKSKKKEESAEK